MPRLYRIPGQIKPPEQWQLTRMETEVLDAYVEHGQGKLVALAIDRSVDTIRTHAMEILRKSNAVNMLVAAVAWDRYSRAVS